MRENDLLQSKTEGILKRTDAQTETVVLLSDRDYSNIHKIQAGIDKMNDVIKHREVEQYEHHFIDHVDNKPACAVDPIDQICYEIYLGMTPSRWAVMGKVEMIIARLYEKGMFAPWMRDMLYDLSYSAKDSL